MGTPASWRSNTPSKLRSNKDTLTYLDSWACLCFFEGKQRGDHLFSRFPLTHTQLGVRHISAIPSDKVGRGMGIPLSRSSRDTTTGQVRDHLRESEEQQSLVWKLTFDDCDLGQCWAPFFVFVFFGLARGGPVGILVHPCFLFPCDTQPQFSGTSGSKVGILLEQSFP